MQRVRYTIANIVQVEWEADDQHDVHQVGKSKPVPDLLWDNRVLLKYV